MKEYRTISKIAGPLVFVEKTEPVGYGELVNIALWDGSIKRGQVLDTSDNLVVVQVFETTAGIGRDSGVRFLGETIKMPVGKEMLGRILSGGGKPIDGGPEIVPEKRLDITGAAINPYARASPEEFIQTGISTIDGTNTLVRGQKLPIFSGDREMERTRRTGLPTSLIMVDLDNFKKVNDIFGHQFGDAVLRWVCHLYRPNIRKLDIPCRYGGDEFAVILPGTNLSQARKVATRLKDCLSNATLELEGEMVSITASFGVDTYTGSEDLAPLAFLTRADRYLMEAKARGGNQVWQGDREPQIITTEITPGERERLLPALKAYGKKRPSNQATAAGLSDQR